MQHDRNPIESMKSRLKSPSSIMNKMQKRGLSLDFPTMQANIMDIAGVRVICSFEEDVFFLAKCLKEQSDMKLSQRKTTFHTPSQMISQSAPDDPAAGIRLRKRGPCAGGDTTPYNRDGLLGKP